MSMTKRVVMGLLGVVVVFGTVGLWESPESQAFLDKFKKPQEVKVINGPDMPASVKVENDETNPVPVVIQSEGSGFEVYRARSSATGSFGGGFECFFDVPAGKRLIMEVLTFEGRGSALNFSSLRTMLVGESTIHEDNPLGFTNFFDLSEFVIIQVHGPFYADDTNPPDLDGADILWRVTLQDGNNEPGACSITGRLIPAPSP